MVGWWGGGEGGGVVVMDGMGDDAEEREFVILSG